MTGYVPYDCLDEGGCFETSLSSLRIAWYLCLQRCRRLNICDAIPVLMTNIQRDLLVAIEDVSANRQVSRNDRMYKKEISETQLVSTGRTIGAGALNGNRLSTG